MFLSLWLSSVLVKRFEVFIKQLIISGKRSTEIIWISVNLQHRDLENMYDTCFYLLRKVFWQEFLMKIWNKIADRYLLKYS